LSFVSLRRAVAATALLIILASPAAAVEPADPWYVTAGQVGAGTFDVLVLRPLGVVATTLGFTAFVIVSPFSLTNWDIQTPWERFVLEPGEWTFRRPLGDF
jgi:hypothetical protein